MKLLTTKQTAEFLGLSPNTLSQWRYLKRGPSFKKLGRSVLYVESDLMEYLDKQTRTSTSHQGLQTY